MNWFFITLGYSGLAPKAPGTVGTLLSLPLGMLILIYFDAQTLFLATILISIIAVREINKYEAKSGIHDDKRIVIDELAGMWFALSVAPAISVSFGEVADLENGFLIQSLLSFALFRYFDITKPSIIGRLDREAKGGLGVVADDVVAGFVAGILSALIWQGFLELQKML
ncbi:phosphatidylglycerophosphatase [Sulfurimonas denitrificans DSM 1251]|jgi:phosphatidylglycerophosphatase A|uniref:Phosphatidylglycerophosphatase n=1 Tax=Sulfurimonas denitrificans (strain ATCC 33889 / DSM 1251) TaxID=326298 RepID=Q30QG4_SULDN|nr:phosphatidylglycerophosphatase A [Sulfurimonas denitrificans]ABB44767.1 phosphatidylglycerophosphatase [Sulfurimonas denitrificans DSM 1251]MDD3443762.1 phosphatidylglycerophosphatase A [Sulfurimonas denitrificans]